MRQTKTREEREKELQTLISTPEGRAELEQLACDYQSAGGRARPRRTSIITYILVHERAQGWIAD
jgi:hypothetical protein